jgi:tetratricopeptide (TPR) repeat protein
MTLAEERLRQLGYSSLTEEERALLRCRTAAEFIHAGQYEAAREALGRRWRGAGERPNVEGLPERAAAELLLQAGALSGWVGTERAQEAAKDLISESATVFERLGDGNRAAAAQVEMALCYWREGSYDEARVMLEGAAALISDDAELAARTALRRAVVEASAGRYGDALSLLTSATPLFEESPSHALKGGFHNELALVLRRLGTAEGRQDFVDRAIIEYTAAAYHFAEARHERYVARIENNLAFLLYKLGRHHDAHEHLDRAQAIFTRLRDDGSLAQVYETRGRVLVAEQRYHEADRIIRDVIRTFEQGGESALLADALTLQGLVRARLGDNDGSAAVLLRAAEMAERLGAQNSAGLALLTFIEEHGPHGALPAVDFYEAYQRADGLLAKTQDAEDVERLRSCARTVMHRLAGVRLRDKDFTFYGAVHELEAKLIEQALEEAGGSVVRAARMLGLTHQTLGTILNNRHRDLLDRRRPPEKRLRSIVKKA